MQTGGLPDQEQGFADRPGPKAAADPTGDLGGHRSDRLRVRTPRKRTSSSSWNNRRPNGSVGADGQNHRANSSPRWIKVAGNVRDCRRHVATCTRRSWQRTCRASRARRLQRGHGFDRLPLAEHIWKEVAHQERPETKHESQPSSDAGGRICKKARSMPEPNQPDTEGSLPGASDPETRQERALHYQSTLASRQYPQRTQVRLSEGSSSTKMN